MLGFPNKSVKYIYMFPQALTSEYVSVYHYDSGIIRMYLIHAKVIVYANTEDA